MSFEGASPNMNSSDDRTMRQRNRVRRKIQQRHPTNGSSPPPNHSQASGDMYPASGSLGSSDQGSEPTGSGQDNSLITQYLSNIPPPKVTSIDSRSAVIQLCAPDWESCEVKVKAEECRYELLLSDKGKEAKYKPVFCGDATEVTLNDLKPGSDYYLRVSAMLRDDLKGTPTEPVTFRTFSCEPDCPQPPKLMNKTKSSLKLKWNAVSDNGSKISAYSLEWDQGQGDASFVEAFSGLVRQHEITRLSPSTRYLFRLSAINEVGRSKWSETAAFFTSGSVPPQPHPPSMSEQSVDGLTLTWTKQPGEEEFQLQMEDETTGHGFIPVYNGPSSSYALQLLRRNTQYKFRLAAKNEEGLSKWSEVVMFQTLPDAPAAPCRPRIKGRVSSHTFSITWDPPQDDGGADISSYIVELEDGQGYKVVYEGTDMEHQLERLTPGQQYCVRVACCSVGGRSEFSESCVATTEPVSPGPCLCPKLQGKPKAVSLHLRWGHPKNDGGSPVTQFVVQMTSPDGSTREAYRGPDLDCVVAGLMPGRSYLFQVRSFNKAGAGPWSETLSVVSGAAPPDAPGTPQLTCRSPHIVIVTWEEPASNGAAVSEYRLEWTATPDSQDFSVLHVGPKLTYEVKGLAPATTYAFRVQAVNSAGPGPYSPTACCQTPPSSPGPITSVLWEPAGPTSVVLSWRPPACNGSDLVSYNISVSDKRVLSVKPVSGYTLHGLLPDTTYRVQIQAVNGVGTGPFSTVTKVTTRPLPPGPPGLECVATGYNSLKLKWGEGRNPNLLSYMLDMAREGGNFQSVYTGTGHTHKVNRLSETTSYQFRIVASNDSGPGPYSDVLSVTTSRAPPPALKAVQVSQVGDTGCEAEWAGCRGQDADRLTYILQLQRSHSTDQEFRQVYRGPDTHHRLQGLRPGTHYQLRVFAVRERGDPTSGPFSPVTHFTTTTLTQPLPAGNKDRKGSASSEPLAEHKPWTDEQWALVIVLVLVVVAVVVAVGVQQVMAYLRDSSAPLPNVESSAAASAET